MANIITKTFTYNLPDDYLSQVRTLGKTAEWTYIGPDEVCLIVKKDTHTYAGKFLTHDHDKDNVPVALDEYHVHVNCAENPLLCCLAHCEIEKPDYADLDQHEELLPDGLTYKRPLHPPPDHTHDIRDIVFTEDGIPPSPSSFPWKAPHSNWDQLRIWRNGLLEASDDKVTEHVPESVRTPWEEHRQMLRDMPQIHGASNTHTFLDLTAAVPFNREGHALLKVVDTTGINVGDDIGVRGWPTTDIFSQHTRVIGVNPTTKVVELDKPLVLTPTANYNDEVAFSPCPETDPHKIGAYTAPDGTGGVDGTNGHPDFDPANPTKPLGDPLADGYGKPY
jgi:hypothetical protein